VTAFDGFTNWTVQDIKTALPGATAYTASAISAGLMLTHVMANVDPEKCNKLAPEDMNLTDDYIPETPPPCTWQENW